MLKIGDKVFSTTYGFGKVIGDSIKAEYVTVKFKDVPMTKMYSRKTNTRYPSCGDDSISVVSTKEEKGNYRKGRRVTSLDDLYEQEFVMWKGKVYNYGWTRAWQIKMAFDAIFAEDGIYVAVRKETK